MKKKNSAVTTSSIGKQSEYNEEQGKCGDYLEHRETKRATKDKGGESYIDTKAGATS